MSDITLRPRGATEIVDAAFALYRRNPGALIMLAAIGNVPALLVALLSGIDPEKPDFGIAFWVTMAVGIVSTAFGHAMITRVGSALYLGGRIDVAEAVRSTLPRLPAIIIATLITSVTFFIGFLFLFAPGLYVLARWFAVIPAIVLDDNGPFAAISRSGALSKGRKWHVLGTIVMVFGMYLTVSFGLSFALSSTGNFVLTQVVSTLYAILAYPIVALCITLLYYDARIRAEGFDVEYMTSTLGAAPVAGEPAPR